MPSLSRTLIISFIALVLFISGAQSSYRMASHVENQQDGTKKVNHNTFHFGKGSSEAFSAATTLAFDDEVFQQGTYATEEAHPEWFVSSAVKAIQDAINRAAREAKEAAERAAREQAERERIAREKEAAFQKMLNSAEADAKRPINEEWNKLHKEKTQRLLEKQLEKEKRLTNKAHHDFTVGETQQPVDTESTVLSIFSLNRLKPANDPHVHDAETLEIFNEIEATYQLTPSGQTAPEVVAPAMEDDAIAVIYEKCNFQGKKFAVKNTETGGNWASSFGSIAVRKGYEVVAFSKNDFEGRKKVISLNDDCMPAHWNALVKSFEVREANAVNHVVHDVLSQVL